jgi:AAA domain-containing protein
VKENVISWLIHGASKVGKSTLLATMPPPILAVDAEGSWKFIKTAGYGSDIPLRRRLWDPLTGPPPRHDGSWDVCLASVHNWGTMRQIHQWLTQAEHDFRSVGLDSITELQRRLKMQISSDGLVKGYDGWGAMLVAMDGLIRGFRDLTIQPGPVECVAFVAETREESGKWRPYMQGQISVSLPYWVDVCGYLYQTRVADGEGNLTVPQTNLFIGSHPQFESGNRLQGALPDVVVDPRITDMMTTIYGPGLAAVPDTAKESERA